MSLEFTVVGVVDGQHSVRIHDTVVATDAANAYTRVLAGLTERCAATSPGTTGFLASAVFAGRKHCAHRGVINGPWGEDRSGAPAADALTLYPFTVVAIDPATRMMTVESGFWASAGDAERDPQFDFYLIASVLEGMHQPELWRDTVPRTHKTSRNERIMAMLKYSAHYAAFFGNTRPIHEAADARPA